MSEGFEEMASIGALEMLRAQTTVLGDDDTQGMSSSQTSTYPVDNEGLREMGPQLMAVQTGGGEFLDVTVFSYYHRKCHTNLNILVCKDGSSILLFLLPSVENYTKQPNKNLQNLRL